MADREIAPINHIALKSESKKAVIAGTGITVSLIGFLMEDSEWTVERIQEEYGLTPGQIYAALSYFAYHREEIVEALAESERQLDEWQRLRPDRIGYSPLRKR
jgi:uncharacterized protein (DUF433 family)